MSHRAHGFRRIAGWMLSRKAPEVCNWPGGCEFDLPPLYRIELANGGVAWPCTRHTPESMRNERDMVPLYRCEHGSAIRDWGGEHLEPPCGCRATPPCRISK